MSVTRRKFLLSTAGAAVGAIVPSFYFRALEFFEQFNEPLLIPPQQVREDLYLMERLDYPQFFLGDPLGDSPRMTHREALIQYDPEMLDDPEYAVILDEEISADSYLWDLWLMQESPDARAYKLLSSLDLGDSLQGPFAKGGLDFFIQSGGWDRWPVVSPRDEVTVSLLQQRLNDLGTGIRIVRAY